MQNKNQKGFTLVELMIAVAIFGLLMAVGVPKFKEMGKEMGAKSYYKEYGSWPVGYTPPMADGTRVGGGYNSNTPMPQSEVKDITGRVSYFRDSKTGLCFAQIKTMTSFTWVPCDKVRF